MKKVLINVEERELRVAILDDDQLEELYIEALEEKTILNNIYKGRIEGILPGLKAAFVNIGLERNAFLHFDDVRADLLWARYRQNNPQADIPVRPALPAPEEHTEAVVAQEPVDDSQNAAADESQEQSSEAQTADSSEIEMPAMGPDGVDPTGRRRRRGRRGGRRRHKSDADQPFDPVRDEVLDADIDDEDEDEEVAAPAAGAPLFQPAPAERTDGQLAYPIPIPAAQPPQPGQQSGQQRMNARSERQRRRRERWEQKKLERQQRRTQGSGTGGGGNFGGGGGNFVRSPQPHPTTTAMANAWVPPAERGAAGTRGAANPFDVFSPYSMPQPPSKRQWRRQAQTDTMNWGNQRSPYTQNPNDQRESQEDFFGPAPHSRMRAVPQDDDERQPDFGPIRQVTPAYDEEDDIEGPMPGNELFPAQQQGGGMRQRGPGGQGGPGGGGDARRRKRRGGRNRQMKSRGNRSYFAARAKKSSDGDDEKPRKKAVKSAAKPEPKPTRARKSAPSAESTAPKPTRAAAKKTSNSAEKEMPAAKASRGTRKSTAEPPEKAAKKPARGKKTAADQPAEQKIASVETSARADKKGAAAKKRGRRGAEAEQTTEAPPVQAAPPTEAQATQSTTSATETQTPESAPSDQPQRGDERAHQRRGDRGRRGRRHRGAEQAPQAATDAGAPGTEASQAGAPLAPTAQPAATQPEGHRPDRRPDRYRDRDRRDQQPRRWNRPPLFTETYKKGDEIMVQVIKEEIGMKGARISTYVSLPGRYLVLLPYPNEEGGISRKVEDITERKRLKRILKEISNDETAFIIRTAGIYRDEKDIRSDVDFLTHEWKAIAQRYNDVEPTALVYDDHDILYRLARDVFDDNISEILIDSHVESEKLKSILNKLIPSLMDKVKVYSGSENIFQKYGVEKQIQKAARRKVWLKSGGYLIIDEAEALTAIDVNTGKAVGKDDQEKLILKTNLEASRAVARELKLRDIGGLIVIDFIDMKDTRNREQVVNELKLHLRRDRSKTSVSTISEFGLVEMTRKRVRRSLRKTLFMDCPYCQGAGVVLNEQQIWLHIKHEIVKMLESSRPAPSINVTVNPRIRAYVDQNYREATRRLEQRYDVEIRFSMSDVFHVENYAIEKLGAPVPVLTASLGSGG